MPRERKLSLGKPAMSDEVFVIMPFHDSFTHTYSAIETALAKSNQKCIRSDLRLAPGRIHEQILKAIRFSSYCIVDVSPDPRYDNHPNPNVLFELGVADAHRTPIVLITQRQVTKLPFDLGDFQCIEYSPDLIGELKKALLVFAKNHKSSDESDESLLSQMLDPASIRTSNSPFVAAVSPLSFRSAYKSQGGWDQTPKTFSDYSGVRGIFQAFGTMYGLKKLPELVNPDDFRESVLAKEMHLYCIGSPKVNRWSASMMKLFFERRKPAWRFEVDPKSEDLMNPRVKFTKNGEDYNCSTDGKDRLRWDYGLLIRGPHPNAGGSQFMLMAGRSALGTQAACLAATTPRHISTIKKKIEQEQINVNLQNHWQAFCAVVSMQAHIQPNKAVDDLQQTYQWIILEDTLDVHSVEALYD